MRANILLHPKEIALKMRKMDSRWQDVEDIDLLDYIPDHMFGEAFEAKLKLSYEKDSYYWKIIENEEENYCILPIFVERVEVLDV